MAARFSVLMPTHNRADVIGYAIRSVLAQSEGDFELLIVGDGCTDNTAEVVAAFKDSRIRWFDLPKAPHFGYANRNIALKQAVGEYIAFAAHDDLLLPDHLALLAKTLEQTQAEWAYSRPLWVSTDGFVVPFAINLTNADELEHFLIRANWIPASCVVHRRGCFAKYGYWPEDREIAADWAYWIRIIEGGARSNFAYCRTPTTMHFVAGWRRAAPNMIHRALAQIGGKARSWWPEPLKLAIPAGALDQEVFFDALQSPNYVANLRGGVDRVIERLAWEHLLLRLQGAPPLGILAAGAKKLEQEVRELRRVKTEGESEASKPKATP
jgi:glycosyltransferase involved in cell wall biosynthesis